MDDGHSGVSPGSLKESRMIVISVYSLHSGEERREIDLHLSSFFILHSSLFIPLKNPQFISPNKPC